MELIEKEEYLSPDGLRKFEIEVYHNNDNIEIVINEVINNAAIRIKDFEKKISVPESKKINNTMYMEAVEEAKVFIIGMTQPN